MEVCQRCDMPVGSVSSRLRCENCQKLEHLSCLSKSSGPLPTSLLGDTFFTLVCSKCSTTGREVIKRDKVNWLTALTVSIYNLRETSPQHSRHGFFHWKMHIAAYIETNWNTLLGPQLKKRKTWLGTVSGTLSNWSGDVFKSGFNSLKESGWWALVDARLPADLIADASQNRAMTGQSVLLMKNPKLADQEDTSAIQLKRTRGVKSSIATAMALKEKRMSSLAKTNDMHKPKKGLVDSPSTPEQKEQGATPQSKGGPNPTQPFWLEDDLINLSAFNYDATDLDLKSVSPTPDNGLECSVNDVLMMMTSSTASLDSFPNLEQLVSELGSAGTLASEHEHKAVGVKEEKPTEAKESKHDIRPFNLPPMSVYEEAQLLDVLRSRLPRSPNGPAALRRFYRKLCVRQQLRRHKTAKVFDFDAEVRRLSGAGRHETSSSTVTGLSVLANSAVTNNYQLDSRQVLDRFQVPTAVGGGEALRQDWSFRDRLLGRDPYDFQCIRSPYSGRLLKPFIRRDYNMEPLKLKLFRELLSKLRPDQAVARFSIDFMYVRPHHIPLINSLARQFFWPHIDVSECLQYPDFSCVVAYRRIVIGFAFLVPDVKHTEAYISFVFTHPEWRNVGIAKFMIYHLIQTCMGKDITLHVWPNNPAVMLYQQFGFKVEEHISNFYDKYLPAGSKACKHALFMRLSR